MQLEDISIVLRLSDCDSFAVNKILIIILECGKKKFIDI